MSLASKYGNRVRTVSKDAYNTNKQDGRNKSIKRKSSVFKEGVKVFKPRPDIQEQVRLLPFPDYDYFVLPTKSHYDMGPDKSSFPCPKMKGEACVVCNYGSDLWAAGQQKKAPKFWSKDGAIAHIIDRAHENEDPCILKLSFTNEKVIRGLMEDKKTKEVLPINDLDEGFDLYFTLTDNGKKIDGRGIRELDKIGFDRNPSVLGTEKQVDKWLTYIEDNLIMDQLNWLSDSEMLKIAGISEDDEEEGEEGEEEEGEEGEEEDQEDPPAEEEEEEKPSAKNSPSSQDKLAELRKKMANKNK